MTGRIRIIGSSKSGFLLTSFKKIRTNFSDVKRSSFSSSTPSPVSVVIQKAAAHFGLQWKHKVFSFEEVEEVLRKTVKIFETSDVLRVGIGSVIVAAAELADVTTFFGGLGAEEIFAGYHRHTKVDDVNKECWRGLQNMWPIDLERDAKLAGALGITVLVPFLDDELIVNAMGIPGEAKIKDEHRKHVLREIAEELGVPKELAWQRKVAAQYGSGFDKAMKKLAKKNGKNKSEYLSQLM